MSLANEYQNCADWVAGRVHRLEPIMPTEAGHLAAVLLDLAEQAKLLERLAVVHEPARAYADAE